MIVCFIILQYLSVVDRNFSMINSYWLPPALLLTRIGLFLVNSSFERRKKTMKVHFMDSVTNLYSMFCGIARGNIQYIKILLLCEHWLIQKTVPEAASDFLFRFPSYSSWSISSSVQYLPLIMAGKGRLDGPWTCHRRLSEKKVQDHRWLLEHFL